MSVEKLKTKHKLVLLLGFGSIILLWFLRPIIVPERIFRSALNEENGYVAYIVEKGGFPLPFFSTVDAYLLVKDRTNREMFRKSLLQGRDAFYETEAEFRAVRWAANNEVVLETAGEYYSGPLSFRIGP
jgi:hypothetical protein